MPQPKPNEKQDEFIRRCVPEVMKEAETQSQEHAVAKCYGIWRQHVKRRKAKAHD